MKATVLVLGLALPFAVSAQKLVASHPSIAYRVGSDKAFLYRSAADTASKSKFFLSPGEEALVVGEFSPRWVVVNRGGFLFLLSTEKIKNYSSATVPTASEKRLNAILAESAERDKKRKEGLKALDDKNGFRAYRFGEAITAYPNLKQMSFKGRSLQYSDPTENLHIGEADLKSVTYFFYKGRLSSVFIQTSDLINSTRVREALETQYGRGRQSNSLIENYDWEGKNTDLLYNENSITHDATIIFSSRVLRAEEIEDDKEVAKKATSDL